MVLCVMVLCVSSDDDMRGVMQGALKCVYATLLCDLVVRMTSLCPCDVVWDLAGCFHCDVV